MAETLSELLVKIKADAAQLEKGLTDAEKKTEASSKRMAESLKKVGVAMAASGAAITAAMGLMGKAAIDEEINIKRLATTINNSGTAYDNVKDSLEALISTTQRKTGIADDEQRNILTRLILVTNDYGKALELLPTVLDLAAAGEMDATTAATYLGKAFLDLEDGAEEVSVRFGQASLQFKNMEDIQNRVRGSAENLANPLSVLKASIGDVAEAIGANLIPLVKDAVDKIVDITIKIQDWIKEHPILAKNLTFIALGLGVMLTTIGGLILILPTLISGIAAFGVVLHAALGPIGLISIAIGALVIEIIWLLNNMERMQHFYDDIWSNIKEITYRAVDAILAGLGALLGWLPGFGEKIEEARSKLSGMIESEKIQRRVRDIQASLKDVKQAIVETTEIVEENTDATKEQTEAALENIAALEKQKTALESLTDKLKATREEYKYSRSEAGRLRISLQDVIFALFDMGKTTDELITIFMELGDDANNVNSVLAAFGLTAQEVKDILDSQKASVDALKDSYKGLAKESEKITDILGGTVGWTGAGLTPEEEAINKALVTERAPKLQTALKITQEQAEGLARLGVSPKMVGWGRWSREEFLDYLKGEQNDLWRWAHDTESFAHGGIVPGPIGQPQIATVHGGETIIPANESMGGIVINFTQPVFFDREDTMNRFVDIISRGLDRKYRLSGRL